MAMESILDVRNRILEQKKNQCDVDEGLPDPDAATTNFLRAWERSVGVWVAKYYASFFFHVDPDQSKEKLKRRLFRIPLLSWLVEERGTLLRNFLEDAWKRAFGVPMERRTHFHDDWSLLGVKFSGKTIHVDRTHFHTQMDLTCGRHRRDVFRAHLSLDVGHPPSPPPAVDFLASSSGYCLFSDAEVMVLGNINPSLLAPLARAQRRRGKKRTMEVELVRNLEKEGFPSRCRSEDESLVMNAVGTCGFLTWSLDVKLTSPEQRRGWLTLFEDIQLGLDRWWTFFSSKDNRHQLPLPSFCWTTDMFITSQTTSRHAVCYHFFDGQCVSELTLSILLLLVTQSFVYHRYLVHEQWGLVMALFEEWEMFGNEEP